jgi:thiol:disulfide interchange protein DsbD
MRAFNAAVWVWLLLTSAAHAQSFSAGRVGVDVRISQTVVKPGSDTRVAVMMDIQEGWHINANNPTLDWLIGTELSVDLAPGWKLADVTYPPAKIFRFAFADDELSVYEGASPIFLTLSVPADAANGTVSFDGRLRVQACDDQTCLPPSTIPVHFVLTVGPESVEADEPLFGAYVAAGGSTGGFVSFEEAGQQNAIARLIDESGLLWTFITIFLIGLALNLTPCVYPMLTVTVSIFGNQTDSNILRVFSKAVVYVLGIASMYSALGVLAAVSGGLFGSALQSPWVLAGIGLLLFALALSSFGLYEITLPYWLTSKLGGTQSTGFIGVYVSGLVVGVFAAPCVGPPVIALLAFVGAKGDILFGFWSFFILSLGLGLPYLMLGTFSGLLSKLPRSGVWMVWVKQVFGVVLTGVAIFYVGLAFFPKWTVWVIPVTLGLGGAYLGFIEGSGTAQRGFRMFKYAVGIAGLAGSLWMGQALLKPSVEWTPYSEAAYGRALADGTPMILDFYADWCIPCIELDRSTFTDSRVIAAMEPYARFKVDLTNFDSPESEALRRQFGIAGVPTIVFIGEDGAERTASRVVGFLDPDAFLVRMDAR